MFNFSFKLKEMRILVRMLSYTKLYDFACGNAVKTRLRFSNDMSNYDNIKLKRGLHFFPVDIYSILHRVI